MTADPLAPTAVHLDPPAPTAAFPSVVDSDPAGIALQINGTVAAILLALGFANPDASRYALAAQAVVGLATQLWARRKAWAPATVARKVWEDRADVGAYLKAEAERIAAEWTAAGEAEAAEAAAKAPPANARARRPRPLTR